MNIIVVGCGQLGTRLANTLCRLGHDVAVVTRKADEFSDLGDDFSGITVSGVPLDQDVLEQAGIEECDVLLAVTGNDNQNIVISQIAKEIYHVPKVITRIMDPVRETVFENFGMDTVCPTKLASTTIINTVLDEISDQMITFGVHTADFEVRADKRWVGKMVCEIPVHEDEMIYAVIDASGALRLNLDPERVIGKNERVVFSSLVD